MLNSEDKDMSDIQMASTKRTLNSENQNIQQGSENWTNPDFEWSKSKWSRFRAGSEIWKSNYLKSGQMVTILSKNI